MFLLICAALLIAVVPLLVLLSLVQGGSGFGLCPDGITSCRNPYTAAPELTATLTIALLVIVAGIRILMRVARRLQAEERVVGDPTPPPENPPARVPSDFEGPGDQVEAGGGDGGLSSHP